MASTQPAPLTLLRVKRARTHVALDALHIQPAKRPRRNGHTYPSFTNDVEQSLRFRRLPALADINTLGPSRVIDIDPSLLRTKHDDASSTDSDTILYNGTPMSREFLDTEECMYDLFARDNPRVEHLLPENADENIAWLLDHNLPIFDNDSSDEDLLSDSDDRSVDYPSTPEASLEDPSEDEWRERERRVLGFDSHWRDDGPSDGSDNDDKSERAPWRDYGGDYESEQEGDNYDYED